MRRSKIVHIALALAVLCLLFLSLATQSSSSLTVTDSAGTTEVYLPIIDGPGEQVSQTLDGVPLTIRTLFLPGEFESSAPDDASQIATAFSLNPFQSFSIISAPYGPSPPIEELPNAEPGGAETYRTALADYRIQQGGTPSPAPAISLFSQSIAGSYSIVDLMTDGENSQPTLIAEWVVEAEERLWIIRTSRDLSDGTSPATFLDSLQGLTIEVDSTLAQSAVTLPPAITDEADKQEQSPATVPVPPWWNGNCNVGNHPNSYQLATYDGLVACGPRYTSRLVYFFPGARGQYEWQCTELAKRYLYLKYNIPPYQANGKDVVNNMPQQYIGTLFERIDNGTPNKAPAPGDVISFGRDTTYGHVAIVTSANVNGNGNGTIWIIEQNWSSNGQRSLPVTNWRVGMNAINWLHERGHSETLTIYSNLTDGEVLNRWCSSDWNNCRNASTGNARWDNLTVGTIGATRGSGGDFTIQRIFLFFDTSSLPTNVQITGATLYVYAGQYQNGNKTIHIARSTAVTPLSTADYSRVEFVSGGSTTPNIPYSWMTINLNADALGWIVKGGTTRLALIHHMDLINIEPNAANDVLVALAEDGQHRPYLVVTYSTSATGGVISESR